MEQENLLRLAGRVLRWGRNNVRTDSVETVVSETDDVVDWLTDPRAGLADESTLVLVREARRGRYLPRTWLRYRGSLDEPGDEMLIGDALRVQVTDYVSLRYVQVTGLTVVRLSTPEDVAAFLTDLRAARTGGRVPETLMSPIVELGDRCALTAGVPCTAYGPGPRLHVSADHAVRTVPGGRVIGRLGDDRRTLAASTSTHAAHGDACLDGPVSAALYAVHPAE